MIKIENFFEHLKCPATDGIFFPDGRVQLFNVGVSWGPPIKYMVTSSFETSVADLDRSGDLIWNDCAVLFEGVDTKSSIRFIAGEGDYGSDGFIGLQDILTDQLIWVAFFKSSNPFNKVVLVEDFVTATNTLGCVWRFKLSRPENFDVSC